MAAYIELFKVRNAQTSDTATVRQINLKWQEESFLFLVGLLLKRFGFDF